MGDSTNSAHVSLTDTQHRSLNTVLNLILPPSSDGHMPGAAEYDVWGYICDNANDCVRTIRDELDQLERQAQSRLAKPFGALIETDARAIADELRAVNPQFLSELARHTMCCYYQQDRVLEAIGMEARAPFPKGYFVEPGDLSLLEPVRRRGKIYKDV